MKVVLSRLVFCFGLPTLVLACAPGGDSGTENEAARDILEQTPQDTQPAATLFNMKNVMIDMKYVFPDGENVRGVKMDAAATVKFKPSKIDEFNAMGDTYYVVDTIANSAAGSVYFILKYDPNETSGWLVIYDPSMEVKDQIEVYYENAEGNFYLHSSILDNIVTASGENITPETAPVSAFRIVEGPRWEIIEH
jgi:hypothetical protein